MQNIFVADVEDGLCTAISTLSRETIQIDCGGSSVELAFQGLQRIYNHFLSPDIFFLSHFHIDHYKGLLYTSINRYRYPLSGIRKVYFPRIPEFKEKEDFFCSLSTMNMMKFGAETGVMEYDFLRAIFRITGIPFEYESLSKGDTIKVNGSIFKVLWPPPVVEEEDTLPKIRKALKDFKTAMEEDEETKKLYYIVEEEGIFRDYFKKQGEINKFKEYSNRNINIEHKRRKLPKIVEKANKSLRDAANHLSLSFFEDNRFLFLGDVEKSEIEQIVKDLKSKDRTIFYIFITPHHGTHWHDDLREISFIYAIASNGRGRLFKYKTLF